MHTLSSCLEFASLLGRQFFPFCHSRSRTYGMCPLFMSFVKFLKTFPGLDATRLSEMGISVSWKVLLPCPTGLLLVIMGTDEKKWRKQLVWGLPAYWWSCLYHVEDFQGSFIKSCRALGAQVASQAPETFLWILLSVTSGFWQLVVLSGAVAGAMADKCKSYKLDSGHLYCSYCIAASGRPCRKSPSS